MQNRNSTYRIQKSSLGVEREIERLKIQVQMGWEKEYRNLQWYGLQNGMNIIELGRLRSIRKLMGETVT